VAGTVVEGALAHGDGAVVLLHSWPDQAVGALPAIARRLRARGATFVGIDELPERAIPRRDLSSAAA
jgi:peptidoglycan/xylan/chitin deacetylase (PgdA/CDA1 family)